MSNLDQPTPATPESSPPVFFPHRLAVNAFFQQRIQQTGHTPTTLARHLGFKEAGPATQLFRGRHLLSRSKHFDALCELLGITASEREAIQRAEQPLKR